MFFKSFSFIIIINNSLSISKIRLDIVQSLCWVFLKLYTFTSIVLKHFCEFRHFDIFQLDMELLFKFLLQNWLFHHIWHLSLFTTTTNWNRSIRKFRFVAKQRWYKDWLISLVSCNCILRLRDSRLKVVVILSLGINNQVFEWSRCHNTFFRMIKSSLILFYISSFEVFGG